MHNGMVNVGGTKMSKSLGNFTTIRALLDSGVSAMTLRLFVLRPTTASPLTSQRMPSMQPALAGKDSTPHLASGICSLNPGLAPMNHWLRGAVKAEVSVE